MKASPEISPVICIYWYYMCEGMEMSITVETAL